ncbi:ABC transporter substrate-binding protein [Arenibacterium sp. CAU 1754]
MAFAACLIMSAATVWGEGAQAQQSKVEVQVTYLRHIVPPPPVLSNLDPIPEDEGLAGAQLGLSDNATTGRFLGHVFGMSVLDIDETGAIEGPGESGDLVVIDAPAPVLLAFADRPENQNKVIFNVRSGAVDLRNDNCRANVLHTVPSLAMRADALSQFLLSRRWGDLVMIEGRHPRDQAFANAIRRSLTKFGLKLSASKEWVSDADLRRSASTELPPFTQDFPRHDVVLVTDETGDFARYLPYNTWYPRPVAGSEGLVPVAWSAVVESWGAAQLQSRFHDAAGRDMTPVDYAAWAALRSLGEAVTRTGKSDAASLRAFMLSDQFELAGFKGRKLSFRTWNGQMRQTIHLVHPRAVVTTAPMPGFLHQRTELDTLGLDEPESACTAFSAP